MGERKAIKMSTEFKKIETQEDLDKIITERLARQKESLEKQYQEKEKEYSDYEQLKTRNAALETQVGSLQKEIEESKTSTAGYTKQLEDLNAKIAGYETADIRTRIALQHGLPYELANRLAGNDETSITADAKKMAELIGTPGPIPPLKNIEPNPGAADGAYKSLLENLNLEGE